MNIIYTSQRPIKDFQQYKIENEIIYIKYLDNIHKVDFSSFADGTLNTPLDFISSASKVNGELTVTLRQAVDKNGVPLEYDSDFDVTKYEDVTIDWITQEEIDAINNVVQEPSELEKMRLEQAKSNAELFEMMLMLTGGGL